MVGPKVVCSIEKANATGLSADAAALWTHTYVVADNKSEAESKVRLEIFTQPMTVEMPTTIMISKIFGKTWTGQTIALDKSRE